MPGTGARVSRPEQWAKEPTWDDIMAEHDKRMDEKRSSASVWRGI